MLSSGVHSVREDSTRPSPLTGVSECPSSRLLRDKKAEAAEMLHLLTVRDICALRMRFSQSPR